MLPTPQGPIPNYRNDVLFELQANDAYDGALTKTVRKIPQGYSIYNAQFNIFCSIKRTLCVLIYRLLLSPIFV